MLIFRYITYTILITIRIFNSTMFPLNIKYSLYILRWRSIVEYFSCIKSLE